MPGTHRDLNAWREAMQLARLTYEFTGSFPKSEVFGLTTQMRRAAVSVPSNIAEGAARPGPKEFSYFLSIAVGSLAELETQVEWARLLGLSHKTAEIEGKLKEVSRLVMRLRQSIRSRARP